MTRAEQERLLACGEIEVLGRVRGSSNQALLVEVRHEEEEALACYKCERGERPLWDFPSGLWRREVATAVLDDLMGTDLIPPTIVREDGPFGPGSLQWWVEEDGESHYFTLRERDDLRPWMVRLAAFDVVCNNADRKSGHVLYDGERCWAIDNGLTFHVGDKLRTVVWDFVGEPLDNSLRDALDGIAQGRVGQLTDLLSTEEVAATQWRAGWLAQEGCLPAPDGDREWPPYPWPLV
jgi:hypothetical protein